MVTRRNRQDSNAARFSFKSLCCKPLGVFLGFFTWGVSSGFITIPPIEDSSIAEEGIDALRLHRAPFFLSGRKIAIGQVEVGRPAMFGVDKPKDKQVRIRPEDAFFKINPAAVFYRDRSPSTTEFAPDPSNSDPPDRSQVDPHATQVASLLIRDRKSTRLNSSHVD